MKRIIQNFIFFISLNCACLIPVHGHDPGVSFARLSITTAQISLTHSYSLSDIRNIVQNSNVSPVQQLNADTPNIVDKDISKVFSNALNLSANGKLLTAREVKLRIEPNDNLVAQHVFDIPEHSILSLENRLLNELPRGHRQYFSMSHSGGSTQKILTRNSAHITIDVSQPTNESVFYDYLVEGLIHIWKGYDHLLFLLSLLLPAVLIYQNNRWHEAHGITTVFVDTVKIISAFTIAHSITLALATFNLVTLPSTWIETAIAVSVIIAAINNLKPFVLESRWLMAFIFGLIHGFGFANVLAELGLSGKQGVLSFLAFNLGVETGQLVIVLIAIPATYIIRTTSFYQQWIFKGGSLASVLIAGFWTVQRIN